MVVFGRFVLRLRADSSSSTRVSAEAVSREPTPTDRELRRIVGEGRMLRRRGLDRDLELTDQYVTHGSVDQAVITRTSSRPPAL